MKKALNFFFLLFFIYITLQTLIHNDAVINSVLEALNIWQTKLFPSLFPFFILSEFLINYGIVNYLSYFFGNLFMLVFKTSKISATVFFLSLFSGFPSSAKYIKELYDKDLMDELEATKLLTFTHFSNPLFILGYVNNFIGLNYCLLILFIHYFSNIIIGLLFRNSYLSKNTKNTYIECQNFGLVLKNGIKNAIDTLLLILGTITFFMIINTIINNLNINSYIKSLFNCFLEMTNGINYIGSSLVSNKVKAIIITMILSFGGVSVHFQVLSIIAGTKIKYQPYLLARLLHCAIAGILVFIILSY